MNKVHSLQLLSMGSFVAAFFAVTGIFVTAKSYPQLIVGTALYALLVYFGYKMMRLHHSGWNIQPVAATIHDRKGAVTETETDTEELTDDGKKPEVIVTDIDKRAFLKIVGATGLSFFLMSLFGRKAESLLFGNSDRSAPVRDDVVQTPPTPQSPTDGYTISEIDDGLIAYYGFMGQKGAWFIMKQDSNDGSFRYVKGENDFPVSWEDRANLTYDYYANVFI